MKPTCMFLIPSLVASYFINLDRTFIWQFQQCLHDSRLNSASEIKPSPDLLRRVVDFQDSVLEVSSPALLVVQHGGARNRATLLNRMQLGCSVQYLAGTNGDVPEKDVQMAACVALKLVCVLQH